jgi:hypothetical protein
MGDTSSKYAGPDYSDIAESTASAMAAPLGKSFGKQVIQKMQSRMSKKDMFYGGPGAKYPDTTAKAERGSPRSRVGTYEEMDSLRRNKVAKTPMARAKYADKAPKINLRKEYKD